MRLPDAVAVLEAARLAGKLKGRDLDVIELQVQRAELKLLRAASADPLLRRHPAYSSLVGE